jgi:NADH-quinone oxidoreductase subunit G
VTEKAGTFLNWEGRPRTFGQVFRDALAMADSRVLAMLADAMGATAPSDITSLRRELGSLGPWSGARIAAPEVVPVPAPDGVLLASWRQLLDSGVMQEGDPYLAATARPSVALVSPTVAQAVGETVTVTGPAGSVTVPVRVGDVIDGVVWLPTNSPGCRIHVDLGATPGTPVQITAGGTA